MTVVEQADELGPIDYMVVEFPRQQVQRKDGPQRWSISSTGAWFAFWTSSS